MDSLLHIARGWFEFAQARPYIQELMKRRLEICDSCENKVQMSAVGKMIVGLINDKASTFRCGKCGCPLSALCANPASKCKLKKWTAAGEESYY